MDKITFDFETSAFLTLPKGQSYHAAWERYPAAHVPR
jgi:hypothetical protein